MTTSIIQWNCQGYRARYLDVRDLLQQHQPLCLSLQETMLGNRHPVAPCGYTTEFFSPTPNAVPGSGLAILIGNNVAYQRLLLNSHLQVMAIRIGIAQNLITLCNIYVSPREYLDLQDMTDLIDELPRPFLITGDFNSLHTIWGNDSCNQRGQTIEQLLTLTDTCLLNSGKKTHFHVQSGNSSAIDLTLCSPDICPDLLWSTSNDLCGSDHFPILVQTLTQELVACETRLLMRKADWETYEALTVVGQLDESLTVDELTDDLTERLRIAASVAIPRSKGGVTKHSVPWWTDECEVTKHLRLRALRRYQRTKSEVDKIAYKRARARAQFVRNEAKKSSWRRFTSSINKDTPTTKIWKRVGKMRGKHQHRQPCLTVQGITTADQAGVANILADRFADVSSGLHYPPHFMTRKQRLENQALDFSDATHHAYNEAISMTEVWHALSNVKNTAPGPDGIHYKMLKRMHPTAIAALHSLFNKIWTNHQYPSQWRNATILAFLKPGKPPSEPSSYRPITLSSCMGKLLEKIINCRLAKYLEAKGCLAPEQFGFRRCRGTTDALVRFQNDVLDNRNKGKHTICVFFDLHKAYDTTWRYGILLALHRAGVRGNLAHFCKQFLMERLFRVKNGKAFSDLKTQNEGVPQGSVISCTLFTLALNGILSDLPPGVQASLYVDDLMLYCSSRYIPALTRRLQEAINRVERWATSHGFIFSPPKTVAMHLRPGRGREAAPYLHLNNVPIDFVTETKFLGLVLDDRLTWRPHLKSLKSSCTRKLDLLKCLSKLSWGADRWTLLLLYRALIRSKIDYGAVVYQSAKRTTLSMIDPVHNAALRLCTGAFRSSPVISIYAECGEPSLEIRRTKLTLQYLVRLLQLPHSPTWGSVCTPEVANEAFPYTMPASVDYQQHISALHLQPLRVLPAILDEVYIWRIPVEAFCPSCAYPKKLENNVTEMKYLFLEHVSEEHANSVHVYTDGSKSGRFVGCAAVSRVDTASARLLPETSVFSSELYAILLALQIISQSPNNTSYTIFSDSKSAIQAIRTCDSYHPIIGKIIKGIIRLHRNSKRVCICWVPGHVDVAGNDEADELAKRAASTEDQPFNEGVPSRDYYPSIKGVLLNHWQQQWEAVDGNKLRSIKDTVRQWDSSLNRNRRIEVALCRLRIGHTHLTHSHLMDRRPIPYCEDCIVPLTIVHLLAECPNYAVTRRTLFPRSEYQDSAETMKDMLSETPHHKFNLAALQSFLQETDLLKKL